MLNISEAEKNAWQGSTQKNLVLEFSDGTTIDNNNIVTESMSLEQTIADQSSLFGNIYSSSFQIQVFDNGDRYAGLTVDVSISVEYDEETYTRNIGTFYVLSDKLTADGISRNLECYDMLYVVLTNNYTSWYESLTFPMTLKSFRDSFFNEIGITQKSVTLQNDSMSISKKNVSTLSGSAILGNILSLNTVWGYVDVNGIFNYVSPKNTVDYTITDNSYVQGRFAFEEYETSAYTGVVISQMITETVEETHTDVDPETGEETTTVTTYEQETEQKVSVGNDSGSVITFQNNLFTYGKTDSELTTLANNILSRLDDFSYTPSSVTFPPYMDLELGDVFSITTSKKVVRFPVLDRRLSGITALRDTFTAEGVEYASENANSTESQLSYALSSTNVIAGMAKTAQQLAGEAQASADDAKEAAETAWNWADDAHDAAETAWNHADDAANAASAAQTSAGQAQASAIQANASANNALTQLSTIEDVFNVLNWIADHGTYALTTDTSVVPGKYYFTRSGTSPNYSYTVVTNPTGNPKTKGYYELTGVDEAVTNYISSHLALTDQGLWVIKDNQGYKVLLANDGLKIYDNQGHLVSTFGESIVFDSSRPQTIGNNSTYIKWYDSNNDQIPDSIEISGSNVSIADSVTIGGMPTKVSDLTNDSDYQTSGQVSSAISTATSGLATKGNAIKATVSVYYRKTTSGAPRKPTASTTIGTSASTDNAWEYVMPQPKKGCYFYTCERYTFADDNVAFSAVRSIDNATYTSKWCNETDNTYIDGGAIYANSVTADKIAAHSIGATHLTVSDNTNLATANENLPNSLPGQIWTGTEYISDGTSYANGYKLNISDGYLVKKSATQQYMMFTDFMPNSFKRTDEIYFEFYAKIGSSETIESTSVSMNCWGYTTPYTGSSVGDYVTGLTITKTEQKFSGKITLSDTKTAWDSANYYLLGINAGTTNKIQIYVRKVIFRRKNAGELIVDGSITADHLAANSITVGKMDEDAQSQVLNSNIQIGGRNLLLDTNAPSLTKVASEANRYWSSNSTLASDGTATFVSISDPPSKGITYGIKLDCTTSGTRWHGLAFYNTPNTAKMTFEAGKTYTQSVYIRVASGTANQCQITSQDQTSYGVTAYQFTPTAEWQRYSRTFTPTSTGTQKVVYFEMRYQNIGSVEMCGFQIEEGNKATTWTPAPEDVDADISDAAKTATNYITADSSGIKVHASGTSGTDYVGITSNSLKMYSGGNELVTMNSTGALVLGLAAGNHVQLTGTGMHLAGKNSAGTATVNRMTLSSSGITMRNDSGTVTATIGDTITLGTVAANKYNTLIDSAGMKVRKNTTVLASFGTAMIIGDHSGGNILDGTRFQVTDTGAYVQRWLDEAEDYQTLWSATYYNTGSMYPGADMSIGGAYISGTSDIEGATLEIKATKQISLGLGSADISPLIYINGREYGANYDLWSGGLYMSAGQTTGDHFNNNLTITDQPNGVVLAWSAYASGAKDSDWVYYFIPKRHVQLYNGTGVGIPLCTQTKSGTITWACKYVYVYNDKITGYGGNNQGNNAKWVLRRVIGV